MSSLKTTQLHREFYYNGIRIPDPGPGLSVDQVRDLLTPNYPEIATASVSGPTPLQPSSSRCLAREQARNPWPQTSCL